MDILTFGEKTSTPVVFLHGWGGGFSSFIYFAKQISDRFYSIVCDMNPILNQGKVVEVKDFAVSLKEKLDYLQIKKVNLVGHSFGGRVIAKFCYLYPEMVEKIVLVDCAGLPPKRGMWYHIKVGWYKFNVFLANKNLIKKERLLKFGSSDYKNLSPILKQSFKNIVNEDLTKCYSCIKEPTLIYWGKKDKDTPIYMAKKLNKLIDGSGLVVVDAGHFSYVETSDKFLRVLFAFLWSERRDNEFKFVVKWAC